MARYAELRSRLSERTAATSAGQWFYRQSSRDQNVLVLLGAFLALVGIYLFLWTPIQDALSVARARHADALGAKKRVWRPLRQRAAEDAAVRHCFRPSRTRRAVRA